MYKEIYQFSRPIGDETGGSYDYDDWYAGTIGLPEIIVTPDGNYTREEWYNLYGLNDDYYAYDDFGDETREDYGYGVSKHQGDDMSQSEIIANGLEAVDVVDDSIKNDTAIWFQKVQESNAYKMVSAASLVANAPGLQDDLIRALASNTSILNAWGKAFVKGNAITGGAIALIGLADGDATPGDWVLAAGAALGFLGTYTALCPAVGLTVSGLSLVCTIVGTCMNGSTNPSY